MDNQIIKEDFIINWKRTFLAPLKKWWIMLLCAIVGAVGGFFAGLIMETPTYRSQAVYMVNFDVGGSLNDISAQFSLSQRVINTCVEIASQNTYYKKVLDEVNDGMPEDQRLEIEEIEGALTFSPSSRSSVAIIYINAITEDKELSYRIIKGVTETFADYMNEMFSFGNTVIGFRITNEPQIAEKPEAKMSKKMIALVAGVALAAVAYLVLCIIELADIKIKEVEDLKNKYNAPIIGTVYNFTEMELQKEEEYKYAN